jgi:hypothetical protein
MGRIFAVALAALLAAGLFTPAQAASYSITVAVDDATDGDLALIETSLAGASDGDLISQSLRRIIMAAVGETWLLVDGRIDALGNLTLDDGTAQPLADGDVIGVALKKRETVVTFICGPKELSTTSGCRDRPEAILVCPPMQTDCRCVLLPGSSAKLCPKNLPR